MTVSLLEELEKLDSTYYAVGRENNMVGVMSHILNAPENQFTLAEKEFKSASRWEASFLKNKKARKNDKLMFMQFFMNKTNCIQGLNPPLFKLICFW